jgi:hypothetical protein
MVGRFGFPCGREIDSSTVYRISDLSDIQEKAMTVVDKLGKEKHE